MEWQETGVRITGVDPRRRVVGTELIGHTLPYEIDAKTEPEFTPAAYGA